MAVAAVEKRRNEMRSKLMRPLMLLAIVFGLMLSFVAVDAKQTATPSSPLPLETSCGEPITIGGVERTYPNNLEFLDGCETYDPNNDEYTISARYSLAPDAFITSGGEVDELEIHQYGVTRFDVDEGSLTITVTQLCSFDPGCAQEGTAFYSTKQSDGSFSWEEFVVDTAVTIDAGESVWLENVTATFQAGADGAIFSTFGVFSEGGGSGCTTICYHGP